MILLALACAPKLPPPPPPDALASELVVEGALRQRISESPADVVIFYGGEHKGSTQTCGCPKRPRGSLSRLAAYIEGSREANPDTPSLLVNGGYWLESAIGLDGKQRADVAAMNRWMLQGVAQSGWDALNVSLTDLTAIAALLADAGAEAVNALPIVSANIHGPGIQPYVVVERGGQRIGITGIAASEPVLSDLPGYSIDPPQTAVATLNELAGKADVVVLLAYQAPEAAKALATQVPALDVVIDTARHSEFYEPFVMGHAVWVRSHYQTMRLGELRLNLSDGAVRGALDRKIDLDSQLPDDPTLLALQQQARAEIDALQRQVFGY